MCSVCKMHLYPLSRREITLRNMMQILGEIDLAGENKKIKFIHLMPPQSSDEQKNSSKLNRQ